MSVCVLSVIDCCGKQFCTSFSCCLYDENVLRLEKCTNHGIQGQWGKQTECLTQLTLWKHIPLMAGINFIRLSSSTHTTEMLISRMASVAGLSSLQWRLPSLADAAHRKGRCEKPLPLSWFTGRVPGTETWAGDGDGAGLRTQTQQGSSRK